MIGFAAIIFRNAAFHRDPSVYPRLVKLVLFSSAVHQAIFVSISSLPFAVGQVRPPPPVLIQPSPGLFWSLCPGPVSLPPPFPGKRICLKIKDSAVEAAGRTPLVGRVRVRDICSLFK
jgi:hypothetical protein